MNHKGNIFRILFIGLVVILPLLSFAPQDAKVHQRKLDRAREKKEKIARQDYEKAVKQHNKNQSASTRAMMKQSRKNKRKITPLKHSSGTKCK